MLSIMSSAFGVNNAFAITGARTRIPQLVMASVPPRNVLGLSEAAWLERFRSSRLSLPKTETSTALALVHKPSVGKRICFKPAQLSLVGAGFLITRRDFKPNSVGFGRVDQQPIRASKSRSLSIIRTRSAAHAPSIALTRSDSAFIITCAQFDIQPFVACVFIKTPVAVPESQCAQVTVVIEQNCNQKEEQIVVEDPVVEKFTLPRRASYISLLRSVAAAAALRKLQPQVVEECFARVEEVEADCCEGVWVPECDEGEEIKGSLDGVAHSEQNCVQKEQIVVEDRVDEHSVSRRPSYISLLRSVATAAVSRKLQPQVVEECFARAEEVEADRCEKAGVFECDEGAVAIRSMDRVAQETSEDEDDSDDADIDPPPYEEFLEGIPPDPLFQQNNANEHVIHRPPPLKSIASQMAAKPHPARGSHLHLLTRLRTCISVAEEVKTQHYDDHLPSYNETIENIPPRPLSSKKIMLSSSVPFPPSHIKRIVSKVEPPGRRSHLHLLTRLSSRRIVSA